MLTRNEKNDLLRKLYELDQAWDMYVADVREDAPSKHGSGALVADLREDIKRYVKERL